MRRRMRRFVHDHIVAWSVVTVLMYALAIPLTFILFPDVSNLWISILILISGFTASLASLAAVLDDAEDDPDAT